MQDTTIRHRPQLRTTVAKTTKSTIKQVAEETGLPSDGATIDYIITDWKRLKRAAIEAAAPQPEAA